MQDFFEYVSIPDQVRIMFFSIAVILIAGGFASGIDLGIIKIPSIPRSKRRLSLSSGVFMLIACIAASQPIIPVKELPVTPEPYDAESICAGDWLYRERQVCEDKSSPIFALVTDGAICGYDTVHRTVQPKGFKPCRHSSHGVERYANSEVVEMKSDRVGEGYSQNWWCREMKNRYQASRPGTQIVWTAEMSSEIPHIYADLREGANHTTHRTYEYSCRATAQWSPIFNQVPTSACERLDPVTRQESVPRKCEDKRKPIAFNRTQNSSCEFADSYKTLPQARVAELHDRFKKDLVDLPVCVTCSEFNGNAEQQAQCLIKNMKFIQSARFFEESSKDKLAKQIVASTGALLKQGRYVESSTRKRLQNFLEGT